MCSLRFITFLVMPKAKVGCALGVMLRVLLSTSAALCSLPY